MTIPEARPDLLTDDVRRAVERGLPFIHQWLNGNGPSGHTIRLPYVPDSTMGRRHVFDVVTIDSVRYWAPAPWAGRVYCYVWPAALLFGQVIAHGEPYRVYDDHATFLASLEHL